MYTTARTHIIHAFTLTFTAPFLSFAFFLFFFQASVRLLATHPYTFNPLLRNSRIICTYTVQGITFFFFSSSSCSFSLLAISQAFESSRSLQTLVVGEVLHR